MLYDYRLHELKFGQIQSGTNKGKVFMAGIARNTKFRMDQTNVVILPGVDDERIQMCRSVFPKGDKWHGTGDINPEKFNWREAEKSLKDLDGEDWTILNNGKIEDYILPIPQCMQYNTDFAEFKKGDWITNRMSGKVRIFTKIKVFCLYTDDESQPVNGWDAESRARSRLTNMYPANLLYQEHPELFDKFELEHACGFKIDDVSGENAPVETPNNEEPF